MALGMGERVWELGVRAANLNRATPKKCKGGSMWDRPASRRRNKREECDERLCQLSFLNQKRH